MSRRGDNIRKRKDGRWEGRYIAARDHSGKAIYRSVYGHSYADVKKKLLEESQKPAICQMENENETMNTIAANWLLEIKLHKKYSTYVKYHSIYYSHISSYLGGKKIKSIDTDDCVSLIESECFHAENTKTQLSKSTMNSIRNVLTQIMEYGNKPVSITNVGKDAFSHSCRSKQINVFAREEQEKLQGFLLEDMDTYKLGLYICMLTGLRLGEICALKTDQIDLSKKVISITQTVQRIKSENTECKTELLITKPKTANSFRFIPICDILLDILIKHMPKTLYLVNGSHVMEPRTYQYFFHRVLKTLSLEKKNFHSLRHTFATNCIDSGMDPKCLSEILGHSDVKTTLNKYVHPSLEQKMRQMNSFASDYGQICGQK